MPHEIERMFDRIYDLTDVGVARKPQPPPHKDMNIVVLSGRPNERMALVHEAPDSSFHGFGESIRREFVLPVFRIQMFFNFTNMRVPFRGARQAQPIITPPS